MHIKIDEIAHGHYMSYKKGFDLGKKLEENISLKIKD